MKHNTNPKNVNVTFFLCIFPDRNYIDRNNLPNIDGFTMNSLSDSRWRLWRSRSTFVKRALLVMFLTCNRIEKGCQIAFTFF